MNNLHLSLYLTATFLWTACQNTSTSTQKTTPPTQEDFHAIFVEETCDCLTKTMTSIETNLMIDAYNQCVKSVMQNNQDLYIELVKSFDIQNSAPKTGTAISEQLALRIARQGNPLLVRNCQHYRQKFKAFKAKMIADMNMDLVKVNETIEELSEVLPEIPDPNNLAQMCNLMGLLHEIKNDVGKAKFYYRKSVDLKVDNSALAEVFGELIDYREREN